MTPSVKLRDLVRCPLKDTNDCGCPSYMVFIGQQRWLCDEFYCPVLDEGPEGNVPTMTASEQDFRTQGPG